VTVCLLILSSVVSAGEEPVKELRDVLLEDLADSCDIPVSGNDPKSKAIQKLGELGTPEAVAVLRQCLTTWGASRELKQHALVSLGNIGTEEAVKAVGEFEEWAERVRLDPPDFRFGRRDQPIDHFGPHELRPLAEATDANGVRWAVFRWYRYWLPGLNLWLTRSKGEDTWTQPVLVDLLILDSVRSATEVSLRVESGMLQLSLDGLELHFAPDLAGRDGDRDGVSDSIEKRLFMNPADKDSDGDGKMDGVDGNPLTPVSDTSDEAARIRQAVFTALFATSSSADTIVMVETGDYAAQEYLGFGGFVLRAPKMLPGLVNITRFDVTLDSENSARVTVKDVEGNLAASGHEAKLEKKHGKWVVVGLTRTWIS